MHTAFHPDLPTGRWTPLFEPSTHLCARRQVREVDHALIYAAIDGSRACRYQQVRTLTTPTAAHHRGPERQRNQTVHQALHRPRALPADHRHFDRLTDCETSLAAWWSLAGCALRGGMTR